MMLPPEPAVLLARQGFTDAQQGMAGAQHPLGYFNVGWYGSSVDDERGSFAVVNDLGPLSEYVGDFMAVVYKGRLVYVYVIGSRPNLPDDLDMTRRAYMQIAKLADEPISAQVAVVA